MNSMNVVNSFVVSILFIVSNACTFSEYCRDEQCFLDLMVALIS